MLILSQKLIWAPNSLKGIKNLNVKDKALMLSNILYKNLYDLIYLGFVLGFDILKDLQWIHQASPVAQR